MTAGNRGTRRCLPSSSPRLHCLTKFQSIEPNLSHYSVILNHTVCFFKRAISSALSPEGPFRNCLKVPSGITRLRLNNMVLNDCLILDLLTTVSILRYNSLLRRYIDRYMISSSVFIEHLEQILLSISIKFRNPWPFTVYSGLVVKSEGVLLYMTDWWLEAKPECPDRCPR